MLKPFAFVLYIGLFGLTSTIYFIPPKELELKVSSYQIKKRNKLKLTR